ncbi:MAG: DUF3105 domain-containing protein [Frankiaceae bacterium]
MPPKGSRKLDAKQAARLRRHELEAQKRRLAKRERVRTWSFAGIAVLAGLAIIAAVWIPQATKPKPVTERKLASFGTSATKAGCDAPTSPAAGKDALIGPGSKDAKRTKGTYRSAPPVGGEHYATPLPSTPNFFPPTAKPKVEQLVANELNGDTVVWYLPGLASSQVKTLRQLAERVGVDNPNVLVVPWATGYGSFPAGKQVALATKGHVQYCAKVSGAALASFVKQFPAIAPAPTTPSATTSPTTPSTSVSPVPSRSASKKPTKSPSPTKS